MTRVEPFAYGGCGAVVEAKRHGSSSPIRLMGGRLAANCKNAPDLIELGIQLGLLTFRAHWTSEAGQTSPQQFDACSAIHRTLQRLETIRS